VPASTDAATRRRRLQLRLLGLALLLMVAFAALHVLAAELPWIRRLELIALDLRLWLRGPIAPGPETVLVVIDDETIARLGRWPLPRARLAEAVRLLQGAGAKVIAFDILFLEPEQGGGDAALAQAIAQAGNVVLPFSFRFDRPGSGDTPAALARAAFVKLRAAAGAAPIPLSPSGVVAPLPALANAAAALGHVTVAYDVDGQARFDYPVIEHEADYYPSTALRIVQLFAGVRWRDVVLELGRGVSIGSERIATDPYMRLAVNYLGPRGSFRAVSLAALISGKVQPALLRNRIVIIGATATGLADTFETPFTTVLPGVERLATVVDSMLHARALSRPVYMPWLEVAAMLAFAAAAAIGAARLSIPRLWLMALLLILLQVIVGQWLLQSRGIWQASVVPTLACLITCALLTFYRYGLLDREHRRIRAAFQRYLAPRMVERLAQSRTAPSLGGEIRELTVLFCDLRGFSGLSERLDAPALTRLVNAFFTAATDAILAHGGTVDKYMGDAVMAFWNAPLDQPDHALLACEAALGITARLAQLNAGGEMMPLACGIGINTGLCTVGNFGSKHRFDYSALGDAVNIAARLQEESKSRSFPIIIGAETAAKVAGLALLPLDRIRLRGRTGVQQIFALIGDLKVAQSAAFAALLERQADYEGAVASGDRLLSDRLRATIEADALALLNGR
jgi:adenylate cyclase